MRIDAMTEKMDSASADLERLREEKDQEIMILQEGVDATLQKMADLQAVSIFFQNRDTVLIMFDRPKASSIKPLTLNYRL